MPIAAELAFKEKSAKLLILLPLRPISKRTFQCETPCSKFPSFFWNNRGDHEQLSRFTDLVTRNRTKKYFNFYNQTSLSRFYHCACSYSARMNAKDSFPYALLLLNSPFMEEKILTEQEFLGVEINNSGLNTKRGFGSDKIFYSKTTTIIGLE